MHNLFCPVATVLRAHRRHTKPSESYPLVKSYLACALFLSRAKGPVVSFPRLPPSNSVYSPHGGSSSLSVTSERIPAVPPMPHRIRALLPSGQLRSLPIINFRSRHPPILRVMTPHVVGCGRVCASKTFYTCFYLGDLTPTSVRVLQASSSLRGLRGNQERAAISLSLGSLALWARCSGTTKGMFASAPRILRGVGGRITIKLKKVCKRAQKGTV